MLNFVLRYMLFCVVVLSLYGYSNAAVADSSTPVQSSSSEESSSLDRSAERQPVVFGAPEVSSPSKVSPSKSNQQRNNSQAPSDDHMRISNKRMAIMAALQEAAHKPVGFYIDFAPDSSVMSAEGTAELSLIASSIILISGSPPFEIRASSNISTKSRTPESLAWARAYEMASQLKARRLSNKLLLLVGNPPTDQSFVGPKTKPDRRHNIFITNVGKQ